MAHLEDIRVVTGGFYGVGETIGQSYHSERIRMNVPSTLCHILPNKDPQVRIAFRIKYLSNGLTQDCRLQNLCFRDELYNNL